MVDHTVLKVWDDKGYESRRPQQITIELLKDGKLYDSAVLTARNSWRHTFEDLSEQYTWTVVEKTISGYTVKVSKQGTTFTVKNTCVPTTPPSKPQQTPTILQTGLLWWPVPVLAFTGIVLLVIGLIRKKTTP